MGVRSLDHLAETVSDDASDALKTLVGHWKAMGARDKEAFVDHVATSVVDVVAASAVLPIGMKLGKKVAKATGKAIRKQTKKIRKTAKKSEKAMTAKVKPAKVKQTE